jgi:hypothetical protein
MGNYELGVMSYELGHRILYFITGKKLTLSS